MSTLSAIVSLRHAPLCGMSACAGVGTIGNPFAITTTTTITTRSGWVSVRD
jgi:hypothetical protein